MSFLPLLLLGGFGLIKSLAGMAQPSLGGVQPYIAGPHVLYRVFQFFHATGQFGSQLGHAARVHNGILLNGSASALGKGVPTCS